MKITFIQTADPIFYYPMLHQTSRTVRQYCVQNSLSYESYVGLKRGNMPWHSAYNRMYLLKELVDRNYTGWVLYMDADAYIHDMDFDVRSYLRQRQHYAAIFAGYCGNNVAHDINSGGFAINLSHVRGRDLINDYHRMVADIPDLEFNNAILWGQDIPEDQWMLHHLLSGYVASGAGIEDFLFEQSNESYVNNGPFIRQLLRQKSPDFLSRMEAVKREVDAVMQGRRDDRCDAGPGYYIRADHPRLRVAAGLRDAGTIRSSGAAGLLSYGPYVALKSGGYIVRIFGEVRDAAAGAQMSLRSDIVSDEGRTAWSDRQETYATPRKGLLMQHAFTTERNLDQVEVRTFVEAGQDVRIHAIQISWTDKWVVEC